MISSIKLDTISIQSFKVNNPNISTAIIAVAIAGSLASALKIITDIIEIAIVYRQRAFNLLTMIKLSKKEFNKLDKDFRNYSDFYIDYACTTGFKGNMFFIDIYGKETFARVKAITDPEFNPDKSRKFENLICIREEDTLFNEVKDKKFVTPRAKDIFVFDRVVINDIMKKKAKDIYSDEGGLYIADESEIKIIKESISKTPAKKGKKIEESDCYTVLGNIKYNIYLAIHKTNIKPHIDKVKKAGKK